MTDFTHALSYLGSPIHITEEARANDARCFFRVAQNLSLCRKGVLLKFARYIRHGFLSPSDAQNIILGRLPGDKLCRYSLAKYWMRSGYLPEQWFYFNPRALWPVENPVEVENITLFP